MEGNRYEDIDSSSGSSQHLSSTFLLRADVTSFTIGSGSDWVKDNEGILYLGSEPDVLTMAPEGVAEIIYTAVGLHLYLTRNYVIFKSF